MKSLLPVLALFAAVAVLRAEPEKVTAPPVQLPALEVSSTSLETGAQFNPFANSFTHRLKHVNVSRVKEGTVAARAGLRNGDHIVGIGGFRLADYKISDFPDIMITSVDRRVTVPLKVQRQGEPELLDLNLVWLDFDGKFEWSIRASVPMRRFIPVGDEPAAPGPRKS